jgi:drug/metabolite transporter (DMT)-like permease
MDHQLSPRERAIALAALFGGGAALGLTPIFVRLALDAGVGPSAIGFWRVGFALAPLTVWALATSGRDAPAATAPPARRALRLSLLAGLCFAGDLLMWHAGLARTTAANATLFANLAPVVITLAAWVMFRERPTASFIVALAATMVGSALLSGANISAVGAEAPTAALGDALSTGAAIWYAGYMLAVKGARERWTAARVVAISTATSLPFLLAAAVALREAFLPREATGWLWLGGLGLIAHVGGQGGLAYGLGRLPAALSALVIFVQPVIAAALAWALFGEALGPAQLAGGGLVIAGIILAQRAAR